jgi:integrase
MAKGNKEGHRRFGNVRKRESGRYQASYIGPDGKRRSAPETFVRKSDAERFLSLVEVQILRGEWTDPERGKVKLDDYAETWIAQRAGLRPRTVDLYRWLLRTYIATHLGGVQLGKLSTEMIRQWRATLLASGVSQTQTAKAYRLLRAVLMTAVDEDRIILRNPCRVKGAGNEQAAERPVLTVTQVFELAERIGRRPVGNIRKLDGGEFRVRYRAKDGNMRRCPEIFPTRAAAARALWDLAETGKADTTHDGRYRGLVLLAAFASLRWGEVTALKRRDIDLDAGTVRVRFAYTEQDNGKMLLGPPKSRAGRRTVNIPASILPDIRAHLDKFTKPDEDALVFSGIKGGPLRRSNFNKITRWVHVVTVLGMPGLHFHDLRHTGNTLAADMGVSLRNLMARMGHDNERAALIYQHASNKADRKVAEGLDALLKETRHTPGDSDDQDDGGAAGNLVPVA